MRILTLVGAVVLLSVRLGAVPPFSGTLFIDPDIITANDPTTFLSVAAAGRGDRWMFDRRVNNWVWLRPFLFRASYSDGPNIEVQVNPEFGDEATAHLEAARFAPVIGRLPRCLRTDVQTVWIHRGTQPFGGGNNNLLIHTGQADAYAASGLLEEAFIHEASHTSLDAPHATAAGWVAAQATDGEFISTYARDNPIREDVAESFPTYLAVRHRANRIPSSMAATITQTIPARIAYFDSLNLDMHPIVPRTPPDLTSVLFDPSTGKLVLAWNSRPGARYAVYMSTDLTFWEKRLGPITAQGPSTQVEHSAGLPLTHAFFSVREVVGP